MKKIVFPLCGFLRGDGLADSHAGGKSPDEHTVFKPHQQGHTVHQRNLCFLLSREVRSTFQLLSATEQHILTLFEMTGLENSAHFMGHTVMK